MSGQTIRRVPLALTEETLRLLHLTHVALARLSPFSSAKAVRGLTSRGALGTYDFRQVRSQSHYLRLVSIVEAYIDSLGTNLFRSRTDQLDMVFVLLAEAADISASKGWDERKEAFNRYHGVIVGNCAR